MNEPKWHRVNRGGIEMLLHDPQRDTLLVKWLRGEYEAWGNVSAVEAANMATSPNPGQYLKTVIQPQAQKLPADRAGQLGLVKPRS
jgi:hypothetical protein